MQGIRPDIKVFGAEPKKGGNCARSLAAGKLIPNESPPDTICDALRLGYEADLQLKLTIACPRLSMSDETWPILKTHLSGVISVTDEEVVTAMRIVRLPYNGHTCPLLV